MFCVDKIPKLHLKQLVNELNQETKRMIKYIKKKPKTTANPSNQQPEWHRKEGSTSLAPSKCTKIEVKKDSTSSDIEKIVAKLHEASHFAPTGKNPQSSRGHVTFVLTATMDPGELNSPISPNTPGIVHSRGNTQSSGSSHDSLISPLAGETATNVSSTVNNNVVITNNSNNTTDFDANDEKTIENNNNNTINNKEGNHSKSGNDSKDSGEFDALKAVKMAESKALEPIVSHYICVDLAGSEGESALNNKEFIANYDQKEIIARRSEAWCINHGLIQLQSFFDEMRGKKKKDETSGFGLRRTLNEFINQRSFISVLFTISPSEDNRKSTESTLRFAEV